MFLVDLSKTKEMCVLLTERNVLNIILYLTSAPYTHTHIYPWNNELTKITDRLHNIEPTIDFIYELETKDALPFLDILQINNKN